jgi:hypothetical protein
MEESEDFYAYMLVKSIERLRGMKREIEEKFSKINSHSTDEEIMAFYLFLVKSGYCGNFREAIVSTQKQIDEHIANCEKQLKEL